MQTSIKLVGLGLFFMLSTAFSNHKYFMSLMQIDYVQEQHALQVTVRIFLDDLQTALNAVENSAIEIATDREPEGIEKRYRTSVLCSTLISFVGIHRHLRFHKVSLNQVLSTCVVCTSTVMTIYVLQLLHVINLA